MSRRKDQQRLEGQWIGHLIEMRESLAWRELDWTEIRFLFLLELEHAHHGGSENGNLVCTYEDCQRAGIRRQSVPRAIVRLAQLGFIEVTVQGHRLAAGFHIPSRYRLTYVVGRGKSPTPTHDWRKIETKEQLDARLNTVTEMLAGRRVARRRTPRIISKVQKRTLSRGQKRTPSQTAAGCKNAPPILGTISHPPSIARPHLGSTPLDNPSSPARMRATRRRAVLVP
jgi:hypothetical protein